MIAGNARPKQHVRPNCDQGAGLYTATLTDDFGRPTRRAWALEPLPATLPSCATFMADDEGSGIYCEELGHDTLNRIVADVTRINESADGGSAEVDVWAYAYTPGDGRLQSATLNGTQGAEYAWSANGTLEALNRDITGLAPRAVGGTDVIVDPQDRLWRFGDIRYGYTPDGRTTWRRERASDGTERLLCLDYDVFSGLRGAQWITEGSGEELGCDEVEEFDGEADYRLDAGGRRIVTERTVQSVTSSEYLLYGDPLHPIARLDAERRLSQLYISREGHHSPTAMIAFNYSGEGRERTEFAFVNDPRGSVCCRSPKNAEK